MLADVDDELLERARKAVASGVFARSAPPAVLDLRVALWHVELVGDDYAFSPDGSTVAFSDYVGEGAADQTKVEIFVMNAVDPP
jgi:hypothetical protein